MGVTDYDSPERLPAFLAVMWVSSHEFTPPTTCTQSQPLPKRLFAGSYLCKLHFTLAPGVCQCVIVLPATCPVEHAGHQLLFKVECGLKACQGHLATCSDVPNGLVWCVVCAEDAVSLLGQALLVCPALRQMLVGWKAYGD